MQADQLDFSIPIKQLENQTDFKEALGASVNKTTEKMLSSEL